MFQASSERKDPAGDRQKGAHGNCLHEATPPTADERCGIGKYVWVGLVLLNPCRLERLLVAIAWCTELGLGTGAEWPHCESSGSRSNENEFEYDD